jgi:hypothetical protein
VASGTVTMYACAAGNRPAAARRALAALGEPSYAISTRGVA